MTELRGGDAFKRRLMDLEAKLNDPDVIETGLLAGAQEIRNEAVERAPFKTGNLRRSITTARTGSKAVAIGTNVVYARPQEFGGKTPSGGLFTGKLYLTGAMYDKGERAVKIARDVIRRLVSS